MTDMTIRSVETRILDVPLIRPHRFATTTATEQSILLVSVTTADGVVGYGEGVTPGGPWWGGESAELGGLDGDDPGGVAAHHLESIVRGLD